MQILCSSLSLLHFPNCVLLATAKINYKRKLHANIIADHSSLFIM